MRDEFASGQPSETTVGPPPPVGNETAPSSNTDLSLPSDGSHRAAISTNSNIRVEWLAYVKEMRILYRLILIASFLFTMTGAGIIIWACFQESNIFSVKTASGIFLDAIGAGIGVFWNNVRQDTQDRWEKLNRYQEYEIIIEGVNKMIMQMNDINEKDKFIVEKGGEILDALVKQIQEKE